MNPELTTPEQELADQINAAGKQADQLSAVLVVLAAALALFLAYSKRRLQEETRDKTVDPKSLYELSGKVFEDAKARLGFTVTTALTAAMIDGIREANARASAPAWMSEIVARYAEEMLETVNQTSVEAMISGYQAQLNRRMIARRALNNVVGAFGVPTRTMNTLVSLWTKEPGDPRMASTPSANRAADRADILIDSALRRRINTIADTETYSSRAMSKSIMWLYAGENGQLPFGTKKMWLTAEDERVCKVCGPMDKRKVNIDEQFLLPTGERVWGPGIHPNCRCGMRLATGLRDIDVTVRSSDLYSAREVREAEAELAAEKVNERVPVYKRSVWGVSPHARRWEEDEVNRDNKGRFSRTESRTRTQPQTKTRAAEISDQILSQAQAQAVLDALRPAEQPAQRSLTTQRSLDTQRSLSSERKLSSAERRISDGVQRSVSPEESRAMHPSNGGRSIRQERKIKNQRRLEELTNRQLKPIEIPRELAEPPEESEWIVNPGGKPMFAVVDSADFITHDGTFRATDLEFRPLEQAKSIADQIAAKVSGEVIPHLFALYQDEYNADYSKYPFDIVFEQPDHLREIGISPGDDISAVLVDESAFHEIAMDIYTDHSYNFGIRLDALDSVGDTTSIEIPLENLLHMFNMREVLLEQRPILLQSNHQHTQQTYDLDDGEGYVNGGTIDYDFSFPGGWRQEDLYDLYAAVPTELFPDRDRRDI